MQRNPRTTAFAGALVGAALLAFTGPTAAADDTPSPAPSSDPCATVAPAPEPSASPLANVKYVVTGKPDNPGKSGEEHGNSGKDKSNHGKDKSKAQKQSKDCIQQQHETRAQLKEQIKAEGGSWGAYQRQETLVGVAAKLAERYGASAEAPHSSSLGRILTLVNSGLPEAFQIDVETFLAQYELTLEDIKWPTNVDDPEPEVSPSPSVSPSEEPSPEPSESASA
jgi:hypothetical protein